MTTSCCHYAPRGNLNWNDLAEKGLLVDALKEKIKQRLDTTYSFDFSSSLLQTCSKTVMNLGFPLPFLSPRSKNSKCGILEGWIPKDRLEAWLLLKLVAHGEGSSPQVVFVLLFSCSLLYPNLLISFYLVLETLPLDQPVPLSLSFGSSQSKSIIMSASSKNHNYNIQISLDISSPLPPTLPPPPLQATASFPLPLTIYGLNNDISSLLQLWFILLEI